MSKENPLVSVVCLCHNHCAYVTEAIDSVLSQTYPNIELIVVDDGSVDGSKKLIHKIATDEGINFISNSTPMGNCRAFNQGFIESNGAYIIDLAADDVLFPERIQQGLKTFEQNIGVEFCNVLNIDSEGNEIGKHFATEEKVPQGDIYIDLIQKYIISPPGMMIKRKVLEDLSGYDETLSYEDFDFWIRSSREYLYGYTNEVLVKKRILPNSLSKKQFTFLSKHQESTLRVCRKIKNLNKTKKEDLALRRRCIYEIKQCLKQGNLSLIPGFLQLL